MGIFIKTGSGRTQGKNTKQKDVFSQEREVLERTSVAEALSPACSRARSCSPLLDHPLEQARLAATAPLSAGSGLVRGNALF